MTLKTLIPVGILLGIPATGMAVSKENLSASEIYQRGRNSIVLVLSVDQNNTPLATGSGFYARDNVIITNEHVVRGGVNFTIRRIGEDGSYPAEVVITSERLDLAALRLTDTAARSKSLPMLPQSSGDERKPQIVIGEQVVAIGNPRGLEGSVSTGIVSGFRTSNGVKMIQITAPISPGSSGGPVFNSQGIVIGVATATLRGGQNLNFSIPATYIPDVLSGNAPDEAAVQAQIDCADWNTEAFFKAAEVSDVTRCLQAGADANALAVGGYTPLHVAAFLGRAEAVEALAAAGADLEARAEGGQTPLHMWAGSVGKEMTGTAEVIEALAAAGADLEARTEGGQTPLHMASNAEAVEALLRAGANLKVQDGVGQTPLHIAALLGHAEAVEALAAAGADLEARAEGGQTPLHMASNAEAVEALLRAGANLEVRAGRGLTPLHMAALLGHAEAIEALLQVGADPKELTTDGELPFDLIKDEQLKGTDAYWKLYEARFE